LGATTPKVLLNVGGRTLLEWHALRLRDVGITELVIVTGFLRERIAQVLPAIASQFALTVTELVNDRFVEGSALSFNAALPEIEQQNKPILLMDADVLYPGEMLRRLIDSRGSTALLLDREYSTQDDDPVLVPVRNGRPFDFRKQWAGEADFVGESIGFFKIGPEDSPMLIAGTRARSVGGNVPDSYDDVLRELVIADRFSHVDVTGLPWTEIDFPEDLVRAREVVLPAIERLA
jgi:choline kinase